MEPSKAVCFEFFWHSLMHSSQPICKRKLRLEKLVREQALVTLLDWVRVQLPLRLWNPLHVTTA